MVQDETHVHANLKFPFDQIVWVLLFDLSSIRREEGPINNVDRGEKSIGSSYIHSLFVLFFKIFEAQTFIILIEISYPFQP